MTSRRRVVGNSLVLMVAETATRATSFLTIAYLSRVLAPEGMGVVEFGFAVFALFELVSTGGVNALLTPEAARDPGDIPRLAGRSLLLAGSQAVVAWTLLIAAAVPLDLAADLRKSAILFAAAALIVPAGMRFAFVATERTWVLGLTNVIRQVTFLGLCLAGIRTPAHVARVGLFWMVAIALRTAVALAAFLRQHGAVVITIDRFASWFRRTTAVGLGNVAAGLMTGIDVLVLGLVCAPAEVGRYGLATKLPLFLVSLIGLGYTALFPTLVRAVAQNDTGRLARIAAETIAVGLGVAIPGAICLCLAAEPLMVLLFTERFRSAAPLLGMLAWRFPLSAAVGVFQAVLWARSPQRNARVAGMVFVTTLAALPYAAHRAGAIGVGCCMLLADLLELVLYVRAAGVPGPLGLRTVARIAAGGGVAAAVMLAVSPAGGPAAIATIVGAWAIGAAIGTLPHLTRVVRAGQRFGRVP